MLILSIAQQTEVLFHNLRTVLKTYDREAPLAGAPSWRYVYHTIHSCDKWFRNPARFQEPAFHVPGLDNPDAPCDVVLTDEQLTAYAEEVALRTRDYLESLEDSALAEKPEGCEFTRLELVLGQFRHFMCHVGMLNMLTISLTGRYPAVAGLTQQREGLREDKLYEE